MSTHRVAISGFKLVRHSSTPTLQGYSRPPRRFRGISDMARAMGDPAESMPLCLHCGDVIRGIGSCPAVVMRLVRFACTCLMRHASCAAIVVAVAVAVAVSVVAARLSIGIL